MATKKPTVEQFNVSVKLTLDLYVKVAGNTFEEALQAARALKCSDLVDYPDRVDDEWNNELEIQGVQKR